MDLEISPAARDDLSDIWAYLVIEAGSRTADRVLERIHQGCRRIADMPGLGHRLRFDDERLASLSSWLVDPYLVFYLVSPSSVLIVRVLHGARDLEEVLREG